MPRSLAPQIAALDFGVQDVRDIELRGQPDLAVMAAAVVADAIIITRDKGFANPKSWTEDFTAGVILINLPDDTSADVVTAKILEMLANRSPSSLLVLSLALNCVALYLVLSATALNVGEEAIRHVTSKGSESSQLVVGGDNRCKPMI